LPPVDLCKGVRPSQAAKSRLVLNACTGGASAVIFLKLPRFRGAFGGLGNYGSVVTASMASS
jgi:hypothetical protein